MNKQRSSQRRRGFSLMEVSIASGLLIFLAMLIAETWIGLGRPLLETAHRCRVAQESNLALACLAGDLGACLPGSAGSVGGRSTSQLVGRTQPGGTQLWLCFDGGATPNGVADWASPDVVVTYELVSDGLVRTDQSTGVQFVAARKVDSLAVADLGGEVQITLAFAYRDVNATYILIAKDP